MLGKDLSHWNAVPRGDPAPRIALPPRSSQTPMATPKKTNPKKAVEAEPARPRKVARVFEEPAPSKSIEGASSVDALRAALKRPSEGSEPKATNQPFQRRQPERAEAPRRVRGGYRSGFETWPVAGLPEPAARLASMVNALASPEVVREGWSDYAHRGQVRAYRVKRCGVESEVQGRAFRAYETRIAIRPIDHGVWDTAVGLIVADPLAVARLTADEYDAALEAIFVEAGSSLIPPPEGVTSTCNCKEEGAFCKHAVCAWILLVEEVAKSPLQILQLRGISASDLRERLRQRRAVESSTSGRAAAYDAPPHPEADLAATPLDQSIEQFWEAGHRMDELELTLRRPETALPILRRLGASPFEEGKFPLVGLLATCYKVVSEAALEESEGGDGALQVGDSAAPSSADAAPEADSESGSGGLTRPSIGKAKAARAKGVAKARKKS